MSTAGYSGTPLPKKLGIAAESTVLLRDAPENFPTTLGPLPPGATLTPFDVVASEPDTSQADVIIWFVTVTEDLAAGLEVARTVMKPAAGLWICWPKKASKVPTDITEQTVRDVALPTGLVDNKVCAIDDTWSGLRLVIRKELRT